MSKKYCAPRVSIVVPVYKVEKYLPECIGSILAQTFTDFELILVDDGSPDNSGKICDDYTALDPRIRVFHQRNGGVSSARNLGLDNAKGTYVSFVDSDDVVLPNFLEECHRKIEEYNGDIISVGHFSLKKWFAQSSLDLRSIEKVEVWEGEEALKKVLQDHPMGYACWGKLIRRDFLSSVRFEENRCLAEDSFFVFELCLKKPLVVFSSNEFYGYRVVRDSASRQEFSERHFDILYFARKRVDMVTNLFPSLVESVFNFWVKANMQVLICLCLSARRKNVEQMCIAEVCKHRHYFLAVGWRDNVLFHMINLGMYPLFHLYFRFRRFCGSVIS